VSLNEASARTTLCVTLIVATACGDDLPTCRDLEPLARAACAGSLDESRKLLDSGAEPNARGEHEWTALHWAAAHGHDPIVRLLLERGADADARGGYDMRPLHWAALRGHAAAARALLAAGAAVKARNLYGMTPLHEAATGELVGVLLDAGASVASTDNDGNTPLHLARAPDVAKALVDAGADMLVEARNGSRPVDAATATSASRFEIALQPEARAVPLPNASGTFRVALRSFATHLLTDLAMTLESDACTATVTPDRVAELHPGQLVNFALDLSRASAGAGRVAAGRLTLTGHGQPMMILELEVDGRPQASNRRNRIRVGKVRVQPAASRWQLLAYVAVPLLLVVAWLGLRALRRR